MSSARPVSNSTSPNVTTAPRSVCLALSCCNALSWAVRTSRRAWVRCASMPNRPASALRRSMVCSAMAIFCLARYANCSTCGALRSLSEARSAWPKAANAALVSSPARRVDSGLLCSALNCSRASSKPVFSGVVPQPLRIRPAAETAINRVLNCMEAILIG
ncbi:hypothetical protein D3C80_1421280 [compost metagenome]